MKNYLLVALLVFGLVSCDKKENEPADNENSNCDNKVITRNDSIIITGCSDFESDITFSGAYLLTINEKPYGAVSKFEVYQPAFSSYMETRAYSASALRENGWYSQASIWEKLNGIWKWRVTATGEYKIVFAKLPLSVTPQTVPVIINSAGQAVIGPFSLSGSTTFEISCPDAKLAGFTAELFYANNGDEIFNTSYHNILDVINIDENNDQINNYSKTITLDLAEGNYLIKVSSNQNASWTVKIN